MTRLSDEALRIYADHSGADPDGFTMRAVVELIARRKATAELVALLAEVEAEGESRDAVV